MAYVGWVLFLIMLSIWWRAFRKHNFLRLDLLNYIVVLLMHDDTYANHRAKFRKWVLEDDSSKQTQLSLRAHAVLEDMAERLSTTSMLTTVTLLSNFRKPAKETD